MLQNLYEYMVINPLLAFIFLLLALAIIVMIVVKYVQHVGLEKIRATVYDGFVRAEHEFMDGDNAQKFDYVVQLARSSLPSPFNIFITEALLRRVIQLWFDLIKDLLDDGKINKTANQRSPVQRE